MPKGITPKERMKKTTISLARSLKPTGRLNADDIKRAGKARKTMSFSEIKDAKKLGKVAKMASKVASGMGTMGMGAGKLKDLMLKEPRKIKTDGRITKEDMEKYMKRKPREYQTGIPRRTKGPMQARPLPMTPELIKKAKDRMVPNPRAQQRDRSKPIIGKPMRRSSARRK